MIWVVELKLAQYVHRLLVLSCFIVPALALAACSDMLGNNSSPFGAKGPNKAGQTALEGRWIDANGISSTFRKGVFETRSPDTNEKLSEGNYTFNGGNIVAIEVRSLVRGTVSHVNCSLTKAKLYCTTENNTKFVLTRG
ncbi:hypothetical protein [Candidatus Tokpelaia sp.]|uniref:hypothetical protein n=1 Tax=Candidatus Tokpelaia sp. TaxID=2233777 RepID=UPI00123B6463|nr:hypothetical protein [Candidatus Tokpelaia sp.]KAA6405120.1 hypothetical protein DPQ22_06085 [Candidatus Tokpelaia sp.]